MDQNANLEEQRRIAADVLNGDTTDIHRNAIRLAELVQALDAWIFHRGALPKDWQHGGANDAR